MAELTSVGIDVGTTTSQMVLSRLRVENRASAFQIPDMAISRREVLYRGSIHPTPLLDSDRVDAEGLRRLLEGDYAAAGIIREQVDTGAIIVTGETSRKENAEAVLHALSHMAGDFVVATAGPELESRLAAKGAGAPDLSEETGQPVLHIDIGGGTSNFAWFRDGKLLDTACLNVGGHLAVFDSAGVVTALSPVLSPLCSWKPGDRISEDQAFSLAKTLVQALETAAGLREPDRIWRQLQTEEAAQPPWKEAEENLILSFSGGVADCMEKPLPWLSYGDLGPLLGRAIRESRLCRRPYRLGRETIRATVIGAGCHSAQLSGSTVFCRNVPLPLKNLPVLPLDTGCPRFSPGEGITVWALSGSSFADYAGLSRFADQVSSGNCPDPLILCLEQDMARALGQKLALKLGTEAGILCLDRVTLPEGCYLDIGTPVGPALPVVVKTLILAPRPNKKEGNAHE